MKHNHLPVRSIMTTNVITVRDNETLEAIKKIFKNHNFHHLPVLGHLNRMVGIISRVDIQNAYELMIYQAAGTQWTKKELLTLTAEDIMTPSPKFLGPNDTINHATDLFLFNKFHALPVIEQDELIGIVTVHDLLAHFFDYPDV